MKPYIRTGLIFTLGATAITAAISMAISGALPETGQIPVHWGIDGTPNRWADRGEAMAVLWSMPATTLFAGLILAFAPLIDPRRKNLETGRRGYLAIWISVMILLVCVHGGMALQMTGSASGASFPGNMTRWVIAGAAILIIIVGNYLPKTRSSFFFGIRTPWTLSSDVAWEKTHRLAGPLFMIAGALGLAGAFILNGLWLAMQLTIWVGIAAIVSVIYSYFAWRSASDRDHGSNLTV